MGGKVLVSTQEAIQKLIVARLTADVYGVSTILIARTNAEAADLLISNSDPYDERFMINKRTPEGFFRTQAGIE